MMDILTKMFGDSGRIRFEGITTTGISFSGTTTIESFNYDKEEIEEKLKSIICVEKGVEVATVQIVGFYPN